MIWHVPSRGGDFRLVDDPGEPGRSILTVNAPTASELERLSAFLKAARRKGWVSEHAGITEVGSSRVIVGAPVSKAGPLLVGKAAAKGRGVLTVVSSVAGEIVGTASDEQGAEAAAAQTETVADAPAAARAVTVRQGTLCCPKPVPGAIELASACLRAFCTPSQWRSWVSRACIDVVGNLSGATYRIFHRHHPAAVALGMPIFDLDAELRVHRWDYTVPAPEEVLSAALLLQTREHWIRNPSGAHQHAAGDVFVNPYGIGRADGQWDTFALTAVSMGVQEIDNLLRGYAPGVLTHVFARMMAGTSDQDITVDLLREHHHLAIGSWLT